MNQAHRRGSLEPSSPSPSPSFSSNILEKVFRSIDESQDHLPHSRPGRRHDHHHQFKSSIASERLEVEQSNTDKKSKKHGLSFRRSKPEVGKSSRNGTTPARIDSGDSMLQNSTRIESSRTEFLSNYKFDPRLEPAVNLKQIRTSHEPTPESLQNAKIRAMKMFGDLKNAKHPISPGGKLTRFITSLFSRKNHSNKSDKKKVREEKEDVTLKNAPVTTCSSATSYYRACLSSRAPASAKRSVRFSPVNVVIDDDYDRRSQQRRQNPRLVPAYATGNAHHQERKLIVEEDCRGQVQSDIRELLFKYQKTNNGVLDIFEKVDDDDEGSCASSDLFELDHIGGNVSGGGGVSDELPVYETTQFQKHVNNHPAIW